MFKCLQHATVLHHLLYTEIYIYTYIYEREMLMENREKVDVSAGTEAP